MKKVKILSILLFAIVLSCLKSTAQVFQKTYGGAQNERANSIILNSNGNLVTTGYSENSRTPGDVLLFNITQSSILNWSRNIDLRGKDEGFDLVENSDNANHYLITGDRLDSLNKEQLFYLVTDNAGIPKYAYHYTDSCFWDHGRSLVLNSDSTVVIVGYSVDSCTSDGQGGPKHDIYLLKVNINGALIWAENIDLDNNSDDYGMELIKKGTDYYITGYTLSNRYNSTYNAFILKTDMNGNVLWARGYDGNRDDYSFAIIENANELTIAGKSNSYSTNGDDDALVIHTDINGNVIWRYSYDTNLNNHISAAKDIAYNSLDDKYYVTGYVDADPNSNLDVLFMRINSNGSLNLKRSYGGYNNDIGNCLAFSKGHVFQAGVNQSFWGGDEDAYIIASTKTGYVNCNIDTLDSLGRRQDTLSFEYDPNIIERVYSLQIPYYYDNVYTDSTLCIDTTGNVRLGSNSILGNTIQLYPNPANNYLNIEIPSSESNEMQIEICNEQGQLIISNKTSSKYQDISTLKSGMYYCKIQILDKYYYKKFVKE